MFGPIRNCAGHAATGFSQRSDERFAQVAAVASRRAGAGQQSTISRSHFGASFA